MNKLFYVIGPPGCGKSAYIARQAKIAVEHYGPDRVAIGSFTKAAAATIAARDTHVHKSMIGTLHSWCFHALGRPTMAESKIKEWNEAHPKYALSARFDASDPLSGATGAAEGDRIFADYQLSRAKLVPELGWQPHVRAFARDWVAWKRANNYHDFTDLLEYGLKECTGAPGFPKRLFIDEAQDNNPLQHALVAKWADTTETTVLCGDPDQTIYSWAGSDPLAFYRAAPEQKLQPESLKQSWRVPKAVHDWAAKWIKQIKQRDAIDYRAKDEKGEVKEIPWRSKDGSFILAEIDKYRPEGSVAVLATCAYMLRPTISALRAAARPFHNPYRASRGDWNPLSHNAGPLLAFLKPCGATVGQQAAALWNGPEMVRWSALVRSEGVFTRGGKVVIKSWKDRAKLDLSDLYEVFEDGVLEQLLNRMDDGEKSATLWLQDHWLNDKVAERFDYVIRVLEKHGKGGLLNTPDVIVGTGHSVKGGEADTVICFPDLSTSAQLQLSTWEGRDALTRLGYVMGTRAKHRLILASGQGGLW